jgi:thiol:disulfide interchange protein
MLRTTCITTKCLQYTVKRQPRTTFIQLRNYVQEQKNDSPLPKLKYAFRNAEQQKKTQKEKAGSSSTEQEETTTQKQKKLGLNDVAALVVIGAFVAAIVIVFKETEFPEGHPRTNGRWS